MTEDLDLDFEEPAELEPRRTHFPMAWWVTPSILFVAFFVRLYRYWIARPIIDDASLNVPTAFYYTLTGFIGPDNWWTQPLKHLTLYPFLMVFGYDPVGWRLRGILAGALMAWLTFLVARRAFNSHFIAWGATALVIIDPLLVVMSRTPTEEVLAACTLLASILFVLRFLDDGREHNVVLLGIVIGTGIAFRLYMVVPWAFLVAVIAWRLRHEPLRMTAWVLGYLCAIPLAIFAAAYLPWSTRGYGVAEWARMQIDAVRVQGRQFAFPGLADTAGPYKWATTGIRVGYSLGARNGFSAYNLMMTNVLVWPLVIPAAIASAWQILRQRSVMKFVPLGTLLTLYAFLLASPRPVYIYSAVPVVPLAMITLVHGVSLLPRRVAYVSLVVLIAWGVYVYPLTSAVPVPDGLYRWFTSGWMSSP